MDAITDLTTEHQLTALLNQMVMPKDLQVRAQRELHLAFQEVDERFVWILDGDAHIGIIDRMRSTLELIAPHPGDAAAQLSEIPKPYHAPTYIGGRIVMQWQLDTPKGGRIEPGTDRPSPSGVLKDNPQAKRPHSTIVLGDTTGMELFLCIDHEWPDDNRIAGGHEVTIGYDPVPDSYFADVRAYLTTPQPYGTEYCNLYAGGLCDDRPQTKRYQDTIWQNPDSRMIRWPQNPVSYMTPGMNDEQGERRVTDGGFIGYFTDTKTNPVVMVLSSKPKTFCVTCCNLYDEKLCCLPVPDTGSGSYEYRAHCRFFSVKPPVAAAIVQRSELVRYGIDHDRTDVVFTEPDRRSIDLHVNVSYHPEMPGFCQGRLNDFEQPIPLEKGVVGHGIWASHNPEHEIYWDDNCGHSGNRSIRLRGRGAGQIVATEMAAGPTIHLNPGKQYRLSGWLKCQSCDGTGARIRLSEIGFSPTDHKQSHVIGPVTGDADFARVECEFTAVSDAAWLHFELEGGGQAWFDDVTLEEA